MSLTSIHSRQLGYNAGMVHAEWVQVKLLQNDSLHDCVRLEGIYLLQFADGVSPQGAAPAYSLSKTCRSTRRSSHTTRMLVSSMLVIS